MYKYSYLLTVQHHIMALVHSTAQVLLMFIFNFSSSTLLNRQQERRLVTAHKTCESKNPVFKDIHY